MGEPQMDGKCPYCGATRVHFMPGGYCVDILKERAEQAEAEAAKLREILLYFQVNFNGIDDDPSTYSGVPNSEIKKIKASLDSFRETNGA